MTFKLGLSMYLDVVIFWIFVVSVYFTFKLDFANLRLFKHACKTLMKGKEPGAIGELSPFQALAVALSGTVGLGNIVGPIFGIVIGGPGVIFWIAIAGMIGMCSKFAEITMAHKYRFIDKAGHAVGGSFDYIKISISRLGHKKLGNTAAYLYAALLFLAIICGGSLFQSNQIVSLISEQYFSGSQHANKALGLFLVIIVGLSALGSLKFLGTVLSKTLPIASLAIITSSAIVIAYHHNNFVPVLKSIVFDAFTGSAAGVGFLTVVFIGTQRAFYASVAGLGISTVIHSSSQTKIPAREGCIGMLEPFFDTIMICTLCGVAVLCSGALDHFTKEQIMKSGGIILANYAYGSVSPALMKVLHICAACFAISVMISLRCVAMIAWNYMFAGHAKALFFILYVGCVYLGAVGDFSMILEAADVIALSLAVPNNLALLLMRNEIKKEKDDYMNMVRHA